MSHIPFSNSVYLRHKILMTRQILSDFFRIRRWIKKSKAAIIVYAVYQNWQIKRQQRAGKAENSSGVLHTRMTLSEQEHYVQRVFDEYLHYSGIAIDQLRGKRILEVGPGDTFGVALKFLAAGARQVVCVDKFFPKRDPEREDALYQALGKELPDEEKWIVATVKDISRRVHRRLPLDPSSPLLPLYGFSISEADQKLARESFDLIVSRSVIEHLENPEKAFSTMDRLLKPGGLIIHGIDFRDHGMFTDSGFHPLTFLTIPEKIYRLMTIDSGRPNRRLLSDYQRMLSSLHYAGKILITRIVDSPQPLSPYKEHLIFGTDYSHATLTLLKQIRPRLQARFRRVLDEELLVAGVFLEAQKPSECREAH